MKKKLNILVSILARGGSKGIKDKNIFPLMGRPLIAYTIKQALKWGKARRVIVSTDSHRVARIASKYGAEVPFLRPKSMAKDNTPKIVAIRHALKESERIFGERYDIVVDLDVTAPLRRTSDLNRCLAIFLKKGSQTLFSVVQADKNPYFNMVEEKGNGFVEISKKLAGGVISRQTAPRVYSLNASIYFYSRKFLLDRKNKLPFSDRTAVYVMDGITGHDINNNIDLKFIEFLMKNRIWKNSAR